MEPVLRNIDYHTTETILLTLCFTFIALARITHENRFASFISLVVSDKYLKIYGKDKNLNLIWFNFLLFTVQAVVFGILLKESLEQFEIVKQVSLVLVIASIVLFVLFKFYLEKLVAEILELQKFSENYNFHKLSYRNYIGIILLPLVALIIYNPAAGKVLTLIALCLFVILNTISFFLTLKNHQKFIRSGVFYFILYLCALELAPYLLIYKWGYY